MRRQFFFRDVYAVIAHICAEVALVVARADSCERFCNKTFRVEFINLKTALDGIFFFIIAEQDLEFAGFVLARDAY